MAEARESAARTEGETREQQEQVLQGTGERTASGKARASNGVRNGEGEANERRDRETREAERANGIGEEHVEIKETATMQASAHIGTGGHGAVRRTCRGRAPREGKEAALHHAANESGR